MKIIFAGEHFYPPKGGGDISAITLLSHLVKEHDVNAFYICGEKVPKMYRRVKLYTVKPGMESNYNLGVFRLLLMRWKWGKFEDYLQKERPDIVITHGNVTPQTIETALKHKIKTIAFVRSYNYICISSFIGVEKAEKHNCLAHTGPKQFVQYPIFLFLSKWYERLIKKAIIISNSKFTKKLVKEYYGIDSKVIYPFIDLKNYKVKRTNGEYITFIRPKIHKGLKIFLKIANVMPDKKFLVVGRAENPNELKGRKNVKYVGWIRNMKNVYRKTKILIVPSIWHEPFGRIVVEAMVNGIPCIVSNRGGLPEAVGNAGIIIKNVFNENEWSDAIKNLDDKKLYNKLSKRSIKRAYKFDAKKQYKIFEKFISS